MSESCRSNIRKEKNEKYLKRWCEWRINIFGKIRYKDLIKQIEFYEKN